MVYTKKRDNRNRSRKRRYYKGRKNMNRSRKVSRKRIYRKKYRMKRRKSMRGGSGGLTRDMYDQVMENPDIRSIIDAHLRAAERANPIAARVAHRPARVHAAQAPPPPSQRNRVNSFSFSCPVFIDFENVKEIAKGSDPSGYLYSEGGSTTMHKKEVAMVKANETQTPITLKLQDLKNHIKDYLGIDGEDGEDGEDIDIYYDNGEIYLKLVEMYNVGQYMEDHCIVKEKGEAIAYDKNGEPTNFKPSLAIIRLKLAPAGANVDPLRGDVIES